MGKELRRLKKNSALSMMQKLEDNMATTYYVHYSCESFYDIQDGRTPRITSIAIRNYASAQTESFSIHQSLFN